MKMIYRLALLMVVSVISLNLVNGAVYRLPKNVKPIRYTLTIEPNLQPGLSPVPYNGSVIIELHVLENTKSITFHTRKLHIEESTIEVVDSSGSAINVVSTSQKDETETYTVHLEKNLLKNENCSLTIGNFYSNLGHHNVGFYLAKYRDKSDVQRRMAVTDFEPTDARQAFPCFDEPEMKAKFIISIIRRKEHHSLSNEELEATIDLGDGRFQDTFKETPDMPVYVVAFTVSGHKSTKRIERHRIFGREEDVDSGNFDYSLEVAVKTLQVLEEFTGINYPLSKMDQFAVPDYYFKDDAMENWGLVIYGKSHLLCTNTSAAVDLKRCTYYIAHEFAHQWFGNLVTPAWWNYTWLSESFAAYFQYYIASIVQPSWRLMDQFVIDNLHYSFATDDSFNYSASLNYAITRSGEFPPLHILYAKGSSIIRMTEHFLTHEVFKKGLQIFLQERKFKTAVPSDLYSALQTAVDNAKINNLLGNTDIADILTTWNTNRGYPVVTVTRNYTTGNITLEQHIYTDQGKVPVENTWKIPINYIFQCNGQQDFSKTTADLWLTDNKIIIDNNNSFPTDGWVILNKQQTGYYRVNYDTENWERIISFMNSENFKSIHVLNRAQLIDDAFNLANIKEISYDIPLRLCDYLAQEKDYIPLAAFYNAIPSIYSGYRSRKDEFKFFENLPLKNAINANSGDRKMVQEYVVTTLRGIRDYLGFGGKPNDTFVDKLSRAKFAELLCRYDDPECIKYSEEKLKEVKDNNVNSVTPDVEETILCKGIRTANEEVWDSVYRIYNTSTDIYQRRRLRGALNCHPRLAYEKMY